MKTREEKLQYLREWKLKNKDKVKDYNRTYQKGYYGKNRAKLRKEAKLKMRLPEIKEKSKQRYQENREVILEKSKEKYYENHELTLINNRKRKNRWRERQRKKKEYTKKSQLLKKGLIPNTKFIMYIQELLKEDAIKKD